MTEATLDDIFEGKETEEPVVETVEEPTEEAQPEAVEAPEVEDEIEETVEAEVEAEVVTAEPTTAEEVRTVPLAGLLDERDKRKQAEEKLRQLEAEKEKPDFWADPETAMKTMRDELATEFNQKFTNGLLAYSMQSASYRHDDYESMKQAFTDAVQDNPALAQQAVESADPGEYIYNTGKQFSQLNAVGGDITALEERIRNEVRAEYEARNKAKVDKLKNVPQSLTDETSAMQPREKVEGGVEPLESILKFNSG